MRTRRHIIHTVFSWCKDTNCFLIYQIISTILSRKDILFIALEGSMEHLAHFFAQVDGREHLDAVTVGEQLAEEIGCRTDVEGEVGIRVGRCNLALRAVQRQGAQVVGRPTIGTDDDMRHRCLVCQHPEILGEISLRREVVGHLEGLVGKRDGCHPVQ